MLRRTPRTMDISSMAVCIILGGHRCILYPCPLIMKTPVSLQWGVPLDQLLRTQYSNLTQVPKIFCIRHMLLVGVDTHSLSFLRENAGVFSKAGQAGNCYPHQTDSSSFFHQPCYPHTCVILTGKPVFSPASILANAQGPNWTSQN